MQEYLTVPEVAERLGLTPKAVRQRLLRGQLPYRKFVKGVLVPVAELEEFLAALPGNSVAAALANGRKKPDGR